MVDVQFKILSFKLEKIFTFHPHIFKCLKLLSLSSVVTNVIHFKYQCYWDFLPWKKQPNVQVLLQFRLKLIFYKPVNYLNDIRNKYIVYPSLLLFSNKVWWKNFVFWETICKNLPKCWKIEKNSCCCSIIYCFIWLKMMTNEHAVTWIMLITCKLHNITT